MDAEAFLKDISISIGKRRSAELAERIATEGFSLYSLIDFSFHPKKEVAFHAAWILEQVSVKHPQVFAAITEEFLSRYPAQKNQSCCRHFTNIVIGLTRQPDKTLAKYDLEPIVEATFEWFIDLQSAAAVQANCMDVLFNLRGRYTWIAEELLKGSQLDGRKFRRQHSIGDYIMDFYCPAAKLCIELDGDAHFTTAGNEYDTERTAYLNSNGIRVLRYENLEVLNFQENVLADIRRSFRPTAPECQSTEQFRG